VGLDPDSLERLVPDELAPEDVTGRATLDLHVARYAFVAGWLPAGRVLDIACGVGYGSWILASECGSPVEVLGVDVSADAVDYARKHYGSERVSFRETDAMTFDDPDGFDGIVSLETVEHLPEPAAFLTRLAGLLRPGGVLAASVPTTPSVDVNPHHLHDFSEKSFRRLVRDHGLEEIGCLRQQQAVRPTAVLLRSEARVQQRRDNLPGYYLRNPGALFRRVSATLQHGFCNRYITIVWQRPE
jgi:SAM-dependent methyltransferase